MNITIPQNVMDAFPVLSSASYIRRFASLVPLCPDTVFDIFAVETGEYFALVTTDYPDPQYQSEELRAISGDYMFEFVDLKKPHSDNETITILPNDDIEVDFTVKQEPSYYYYYIADTRQNLQ